MELAKILQMHIIFIRSLAKKALMPAQELGQQLNRVKIGPLSGVMIQILRLTISKNVLIIGLVKVSKIGLLI